MSRLARHAFVLAIVAGLIATSIASAPVRARGPVPSEVAAGSTGAGEVALPEWMRPPRGGGAQSLPEWLSSVEDTGLWSGTDDRALFFGLLPTGALVKTMGRTQNGRLLVYYAGDGVQRQPGQAWVDAMALAPAQGPVAAPAVGSAPAFRALASPPRRILEASPPRVTARFVAVIDEDSGELLYGATEHTRVPPASTTKIATTIVALEMPGASLNQVVHTTVSGSQMAARDGSSIMGIEPGEQLRLETLLYGMMLPSGNDAAEQVALALGGGNRQRYVEMMNQKAAAIGLKNTRFANPTGMDAPGHYSSAYDMAMLARYAMRNADFRNMAGAYRWTGDDYLLRNSNRLIGYYGGADGVKIGFTDQAGKTMVASATRDGHRVYVCLMGSEDLLYDSVALLDWAWESFSWQ